MYSHVDRMVTLGCMPVTETVSIDKGIDCWKNFGTHYFLERREIGIFNIGGAGQIVADGQEFNMGYKDCLYITKGTREVHFSSQDAANPAKFYMVSAPAHLSLIHICRSSIGGYSLRKIRSRCRQGLFPAR